MPMMRNLLHRLCLLALLVPAVAGAAVQELDRVVAVVNDDVVTLSELQDRLFQVRRQLQQQGTPAPPEDVLKRQVLERLVLERIQLERAHQRGLQVEDETLNQVIRNIARENGLSLDQLRQVLQRDGLPFSEFRENIRNDILVRRLRTREVDNRVSVSEQEVDRFLENRGGAMQNKEYRLSHILIAVPEAADPAEVQKAREEAEGILGKLRDGANFAELAVAHSDGQQALEGGDLGWRQYGRLPTLFSDVVANMAEGEVTDPIRSPSGFHILRLEQIRGEQRHLVRQTHARHILLQPDAVTDDTEIRQRLERLRRRIQSGEGFSQLARAHSDDQVSAADGGDLGWVGPGEMVPRFEEAMNALEPGEVSEPFRSRFGWHIVQVLERRQYDDTEDFRRNQARRALRQRKIEEEVQQWVRQLLDQAYVEYRLEEG